MFKKNLKLESINKWVRIIIMLAVLGLGLATTVATGGSGGGGGGGGGIEGGGI